MVKIHKPFTRTVLTKLIVTFLCAILPIYVIGVSIYFWGMDTLRSEISSVMQSQGDHYVDYTEKDIERIQILEADMVTNSSLNKLVNALPVMSRYEKVEAMQNLMERLAAIAHSSPMIDTVKIHIPELGKSIYSSGFANDLEKKEFDLLNNEREHSDKQLIMNGGIPYLVLVGSFYDSYDKPYNAYTLVIRLKPNELTKSLEALETYNSEGFFLLDYQTDQAIVMDDKENISGTLKRLAPAGKVMQMNGFKPVVIGRNKYIVTYSHSEYLDLVLVKYVLEQEVFSSIKKYKAWFWVLTAVALLVIVLYSYFTLRFIGHPISRLVHYFKKAEEGDLKSKIDYRFNDEFGYLYTGFNRMVEKLDEMIGQVYEQKILVQKADLKQLQSQINPHFLYNSFFIFQRTILSGDTDTAAAFSEKLGNYFRYITKNSSDNVSMKVEVDHARIYAEIQALRFEKRLTVDYGELPEKFHYFLVPRLILQPILENSFEHGLQSKMNKGLLRISYIEASDSLAAIVEDNGDISTSDIEELSSKLSGEQGSVEITGLVNIHKRIRLLFGDNSGITVNRSELGGLKVTLAFEVKNF